MTKPFARFCLAALCLAAPHAWAQSTSGNSGNGLFIGGITAPVQAGSSNTCVQVTIAGEKPSPYSCLNQQLQQQAQGTAQSVPSIPLGANSPSNQVGTFNEQGVKEQYGQNFGKSAVPYRPPPMVYSNSLHAP
jgi:hypothetical protein